MRIKTNPTIDIERDDIVTIRKAMRLCNELIESLAQMTISDDGCIVCADNGEVFVTEKEMYDTWRIFDRMGRIFEEAPEEMDGSGHKILAVEFNY